MAFPRAAGYNNLPNGNFSPTIFSKMAQVQFRKKSVVEDITNSNYFGEISAFGDSVRIIKEPEIEVTPLKRGSQVTPQDLIDEDFTLVIDQANKFAFKTDDIEEKHSHVDWMKLATDRAAYKMKDKYDEEVLGYLCGYEKVNGIWQARTAPNGTKAESTADADELLSSLKMGRDQFVSGGAATDSIVMGVDGTYDATPLQILNRMNRLLDQNNVPTDGRWVVIDPVFKEKLMDENSKLVNADYNHGSGGEGLNNGRLAAGTIRGFRVYETNNLPYLGTGPDTIDADGSNANFGIIMAGHDSAVATAQQMANTETLRDQFGFADIVRGMHLYGRKILRPETLVRAAYNINA